MRHFLVFLPAFVIVAVLGAESVSNVVSRHFNWKKESVLAVLLVSLAGTNIAANFSIHPYQTIYFNALAGGLRGAQTDRRITSWDYWLNSYREAGAWLDVNAKPDAKIIELYPSRTPAAFNEGLLRYSLKRTDLTPLHRQRISRDLSAAFNTYILYFPTKGMTIYKSLLEDKTLCQKVFEIKRQGGEVLTIYYRA
jgi:hypothetical protein